MSDPTFRELFGRAADVRASAPGRVNLIGEHTDYNDGFVLPTVIPQETRVELARSEGQGRGDGGTVRAWSAMGGAPVEYVLGGEAKRGSWIDYVQGVTDVLRRSGFAVGGFDVRIESEVPVGAGLSSSAALEVALLRALRSAFDLVFDDLRLALLAQAVETEFVGAPIGVMDQMASSLGRHDAALFIDTRTLAYERIGFPAELELAVIDSGVAHSHATGDYKTRRRECETAAALLGVPSLREVTLADLERHRARLDDVSFRRARHVVTENDRVLAAVAALRAGDVVSLGTLFAASHRSMRDDYEVSVPEVDALVDIAAAEPEVYGARLTGGGFGGAIVALVGKGRAGVVAPRIADAYGRRFRQRATVLVPRPAAQITAGA